MRFCRFIQSYLISDDESFVGSMFEKSAMQTPKWHDNSMMNGVASGKKNKAGPQAGKGLFERHLMC
jgi:hypothetical protein